MSSPRTAMVLAAGLGTRMRPLTLERPKALIEVGGRALIDHILDRLAEVGVERAVVNVHAFADQMIAHLEARAGATAMQILISDERDALLETGGGIKKARAQLGEGPIWAANADYVWIDGPKGAMAQLAQMWDPAAMDACVFVVPKARTQGFDTPGDFFRDAGGRLTHRGGAPSAPLHCFGVQILDPQPVYATVQDRFSLFGAWMAASAKGRLFGYEPEGFWMQVGDPAALAAAERRLAGQALGAET